MTEKTNGRGLSGERNQQGDLLPKWADLSLDAGEVETEDDECSGLDGLTYSLCRGLLKSQEYLNSKGLESIDEEGEITFNYHGVKFKLNPKSKKLEVSGGF